MLEGEGQESLIKERSTKVVQICTPMFVKSSTDCSDDC
jgi:hypothetical protein